MQLQVAVNIEMEKGDGDIVIVGGGICGLATAVALHRKGFKSIVLERSDTVRATGAAIIVRQNGWTALRYLGLNSKLRLTAIRLQANGECRVLRRRDLIQTLAENLPPNTIHFGSKVVSITMDPTSTFPILQLEDGSILNPKIVIGCDGVNSCVAKMLGVDSTMSFSTTSTRGFTTYEDGHHLGNNFSFLGKPSDHLHMGKFPVTDKLVYWFLTKKSNPQDAMVSKDPVLIKKTAMEAIKGFPQQRKEMVEKCDLNSLHLTDLRYRPPWNLLRHNFHRGTVTVAGDAMHAMGPFLAQGGSASLEDAVVLARCLADKMSCITPRSSCAEEKSIIEAALKQYVKARRYRLLRLCMQTFLYGTIWDTSSKAVRFIAIALMGIFFRDPDACADYDWPSLSNFYQQTS